MSCTIDVERDAPEPLVAAFVGTVTEIGVITAVPSTAPTATATTPIRPSPRNLTLVTPDHHDSSPSYHEDTIDFELEQARKRATLAEGMLKSLGSGLRRLARQIQQFATDENTTTSASDGEESASSLESPSSSSSFAFSQDPLWMEFMKHDSTTAAAWSSLENAVSMLQEHSRLAADEASVSQSAQVQAQEWKERAERAESSNQDLRLQNGTLTKQVQRLSTERRVLVKEVKALRGRVENAEKKDVWRQVENYVVRALSVHESQLAKSSENKKQRQQTSPSAEIMDETDVDSTLDSNVTVGAQEAKSSSDPESEPDLVPVEIPLPEPVPLVSSLPTHPPPRSLGFGGHVALGFGRGVAKAASAISSSYPNKVETAKPKEVEPVTKPAEDTPPPSKPSKEEDQQNTTAAPYEPLRLQLTSSASSRSRVNSGETFEMLGSTVKKLLQSGSNGLSAITLSSGRTSPLISLETPISQEYYTLAEVVTRVDDGSKDFSLVTTEDVTLANDSSQQSQSSSSVPGHIVASFSKDVSQLGSPLLLTPSQSPSSLEQYSNTLVIELDCDPRILRSLSIPMVSKGKKEEEAMSSCGIVCRAKQ